MGILHWFSSSSNSSISCSRNSCSSTSSSSSNNRSSSSVIERMVQCQSGCVEVVNLIKKTESLGARFYREVVDVKDVSQYRK